MTRHVDRDQRIFELRESGLTFRQIAERIPTTRSAVSGVIWRSKNLARHREYQREYQIRRALSA